MAHPATHNLTVGSTITAIRQPDLNIELFLPPYIIPVAIQNNWAFNSDCPETAIYFADNTPWRQLPVAFNYATTLTQVDAYRFDPLDFGSMITGASGGSNTSTGHSVLGARIDEMFCNTGARLIAYYGSSILLPGINATGLNQISNYQLLNANQPFPAPGTGNVGTSGSFQGSGRGLQYMNYLGGIFPACIFWSGNAHMDFVLVNPGPNSNGYNDIYLYGFDNYVADLSFTFVLNNPWFKYTDQFNNTNLNYSLVVDQHAGSHKINSAVYSLSSSGAVGITAPVVLDDPNFDALIQGIGTIANGNTLFNTKYGFVFPSTAQFAINPSSPWSAILLSPDCTKWARINYWSKDIHCNQDLGDNIYNGQFLDRNGVFYFRGQVNKQYIYNSYAMDLNLNFPALLNLSQVSPYITLPKFCGCRPYDLGVSLKQ